MPIRSIAALLTFGALLVGCRTAAVPAPVAEAARVEAAKLAVAPKFDHSQKDHRQTSCNSCHVRDTRDAAAVTPAWPYHGACVQCHAQESFLDTAASKPLCQVCHPAAGALHDDGQTQLLGFPNKLASFGLKEFSHRTHADSARMPAAQDLGCASCHSSNRAEPVAMPGHAECYRCHVHTAGQKLGGCGDCHGARPNALTYSGTTGMPTVRYAFTHATHRARKDGQAIPCTACHATRAPQQPLLSDIVRIDTPRGAQHQSGCWQAGCHASAQEPGCKKCHREGVPR